MKPSATAPSCQYIAGVASDNGGTHMLYCDAAPTHAVSVNGMSPLHVCAMHATRLKVQHESQDVVTTKL